MSLLRITLAIQNRVCNSRQPQYMQTYFFCLQRIMLASLLLSLLLSFCRWADFVKTGKFMHVIGIHFRERSIGNRQYLQSAVRTPQNFHTPHHHRHNGIRLEGRRPHVRISWIDTPTSPLTMTSYNRYLAVASRVVRRSLKEEKRIQAERRGEAELRFSKWEVRDTVVPCGGYKN